MAKRSGDDRNQQRTNGEEIAIPSELLLRRDQNIRYERNGTVYATDDRVGILKQVVVDDATDEIAELVIEVDGAGRTVLLPTDLVDKTAGSALFLTENRVQFTERVANAPGFERKHFGRVDPKSLVAALSDDGPRSPRRTVVGADRDYVETPLGRPRAWSNRRQTAAPNGEATSDASVGNANGRRVIFGRP